MKDNVELLNKCRGKKLTGIQRVNDPGNDDPEELILVFGERKKIKLQFYVGGGDIDLSGFIEVEDVTNKYD